MENVGKVEADKKDFVLFCADYVIKLRYFYAVSMTTMLLI